MQNERKRASSMNIIGFIIVHGDTGGESGWERSSFRLELIIERDHQQNKSY